MAYAEGTSVAPERSQQEIAQLVRKYGAAGFMSGWDEGIAVVMFHAHGRQVRFTLELPTDWHEFIFTPSKQRRTGPGAKGALDAEVRRRWRALALAIKAKLECVETGISTFEHEFAMNIVLPTGQTVAEVVLPAINTAYAGGHVPPLLGITAGTS
ncbi:MAG TPA: hypothetical protein VGH54_21315 [Mycobacterium sp.]|jgi:hypothetical protein|uniref:hypothetical protein n=1 Tax=Mycobacterium sp. TaxID=1785 RepID=UPI002F4236F3